LCAVLCRLTGQKIGLTAQQLNLLVRVALTMNIGMARAQDVLARQEYELEDWQRDLIREHPQRSVAIVQSYGVVDEEYLGLLATHHDSTVEGELPHMKTMRSLLQLADIFVARLAARKSRAPLAAVEAVRKMVLGAEGDALGVGSAMAQAVGFYPPGTYVQLAQGEIAVVVQRGLRANKPWVLPIADPQGLPIAVYNCYDSGDLRYAIQHPVDFQSIRIALNDERVRKARQKIRR
jgi:hypothetical protein